MAPPLSHRMHLAGHTRRLGKGVRERVETELPAGARLLVEGVHADESNFRESGTLDFGGGDVIHLRTLGTGHLTPSAQADVTHGTVTWDIDGGSGRFTGASGRISSSFTVTADGRVDDEHVGLVFLAPAAPEDESNRPTSDDRATSTE